MDLNENWHSLPMPDADFVSDAWIILRWRGEKRRDKTESIEG
jgi:hypothetical protein